MKNKINELAEKAKYDMNAREELAESLNDLVASRVNLLTKYYGSLSWQDFFQEGRVGLIIALNKYERFKNGKERNFVTYATYWIDKYIKNAYLQKNHFIRRPRNVEEDYYKIKNVNNTETKIEELVKVTNLSRKRIEKALAKEKIFFTNFFLYKTKSTEEIEDEIYYKKMASFFLSLLGEKEKSIIKMHFYDELTWKEISEKFGVSRQTVIRRINDIKKRLKNVHENKIEAKIVKYINNNNFDEKERKIICSSYGIYADKTSIKDIASELKISVPEVKEIKANAEKKLMTL